MTVRDLINRSARLASIVAAGETLNASDAADCLDIFNDLLDAWAADRLTIYQQSRTEFALVNGTQRYTLGTGGTWNLEQPVWIDRAAYKLTTGDEKRIDLFSRDEWADISPKNLTGPQASGIFVNPGPVTADVDVWPVPTDATVKIVIYAPSSQISSVASLDTVLSLRKGWSRALRTNLAIELAAEFGTTPVDGVPAMAIDSLALIKSNAIVQDEELEIDPALTPDLGASWSARSMDFYSS